MPTPNSLRRQVESALVELIRLELAVATTPVIISGPRDSRVVTWSCPAEHPNDPNLFRMPMASLGQYVGMLESVNYSCILADGALIQVSYEVSRGEIVGHRLCYIPCPFDLEEYDIESEGDVLETVEMLASDLGEGGLGRSSLRLCGPVRFDFDPQSQAILHEASHLHVMSPDCRLPVFGPLSVWQFFRFLLQSFYPTAWSADRGAQRWPRHHLGHTMLAASQSDMFIECRSIP